MMSTPISDDVFIDVIEKFNDCPTFFIELLYQIDFENTTKIVTPFVSVYLTHFYLNILRNTVQYFIFSTDREGVFHSKWL